MRMRIAAGFVLVLALAPVVRASSAEEEIVGAVRAMYDALGRDDATLLGRVTAPDFHAIDGGERMTGAELLELVRAAHSHGATYVWKVTEHAVQLESDTAWVTWVNRGSIGDAEETRAVTWLESAVLSRVDDTWRIRFLHSTRVAVEGPAEPTAAEVEAELVRQADAWDRAIVLKNRAAIEANLADDFRQIRGDGGVVERAAFIDGLLDPKLEIDPYTVEELSVRRFGDVALLSGRTRMTGRYAGEPFVTHYRYIDVYVRRDGVWRVVSVQITRLPDEPGLQ